MIIWQITILPITDKKCIQVLAPAVESDKQAEGEFYAVGEHIGHLDRISASILAPFFDDLSSDVCKFQCHLLYSDTNHSRSGYDVDIVLSCNGTSDGNNELFGKFEALNLNPRI